MSLEQLEREISELLKERCEGNLYIEPVYRAKLGQYRDELRKNPEYAKQKLAVRGRIKELESIINCIWDTYHESLYETLDKCNFEYLLLRDIEDAASSALDNN